MLRWAGVRQVTVAGSDTLDEGDSKTACSWEILQLQCKLLPDNVLRRIVIQN